jgi:hypothetical protein
MRLKVFRVLRLFPSGTLVYYYYKTNSVALSILANYTD